MHGNKYHTFSASTNISTSGSFYEICNINHLDLVISIRISNQSIRLAYIHETNFVSRYQFTSI